MHVCDAMVWTTIVVLTLWTVKMTNGTSASGMVNILLNEFPYFGCVHSVYCVESFLRDSMLSSVQDTE